MPYPKQPDLKALASNLERYSYLIKRTEFQIDDLLRRFTKEAGRVFGAQA